MVDKIPHLIAEMRNIHTRTCDWLAAPKPHCDGRQMALTRQYLTVIVEAMEEHYICYESWSDNMSAVALSMPDSSGVYAPHVLFTTKIPKLYHNADACWYGELNEIIGYAVRSPCGEAALRRFDNLGIIFAAPVLLQGRRGESNYRNMVVSVVRRLREAMSDSYAVAYMPAEACKFVLNGLCGPIETADRMSYCVGGSKDDGVDGDIEYIPGLLNGPVAAAMIEPTGTIMYAAGNIADDAKFRQRCLELWRGLDDGRRTQQVVITLIAYKGY